MSLLGRRTDGNAPSSIGYHPVFYVYILRCADGSYYVGSASNVAARVREHNEGRLGAAHTFLRRPATLVHSERFETQAEAMRRERQVKGWSHAKKRALVTRDAAALKALSKRGTRTRR